ncbi:MAG: transglycosylase SLT domain-containing protein [Sandaracinaceae bacterium]
MLASVWFRVSVGALAATLSTCSTPAANTTPAPAQADTEEAVEDTAPTFDPDVVRLEAGSPQREARDALDAGDPERAQAIATAALATAEGDALIELWWLSARASREAGTPARGFATLANVSTSEHALAPWARLWRARILMEADPALALEEVTPLTELDWAGQDDAREIAALALAQAGHGEEAEPALRARLASAPDEVQATVAMELAELLAIRDDEAAKTEAVSLLRRVWSRAPLSNAAERAEGRIAAIVSELPRAARRTWSEPTAEELSTRAEALAGAMRFHEAEETFTQAAARAHDPELACQARYGAGRAIYYQRQRRRAGDVLRQVAHDCEATEVRAWSLYLAAKGYQSAGEVELALELYGRLEEQAPSHSLADDARYRAALMEGERGHADAMRDALTGLIETYPQGDMRGRARFALAWNARAAGDLEGALAHLDALLRDGDGETAREDLGGRAAYWRGVTLAGLNREPDAIEAWTSVLREAPLSYHAMQALSRLDEVDEAAALRARAALGERGTSAIRFAWRDELDTEAFARALALLRVGEVGSARAELRYVSERSSHRDDALGWIEAALLDRAGAHADAVRIARRSLRDFMDQPPSGEHYAKWRIAFPRAYASQILAATESRPVPAELVFAIAREESSFQADAVSPAHAYGLTQLILPTARRFGRPLGVTVNERTLRDPTINTRIGAEYMTWLWNRYADNPVVLPAAYNAGQGATDRWLTERSGQRLDEWVEEIPYDETRGYTRRVLQSWGIYSWLDHGSLPTLRAQLPER